MSDRFAGQLTIGGKLDKQQVEALIDILNGEVGVLYPEWEGLAFNPTTKQDLVDALDKNGHIVLCESEIRNGEFEGIEPSLQDAGIAYQRWSDSYCEYDAEVIWWRPGMDCQQGVIVDGDANPVLMQQPVALALDKLNYALSNPEIIISCDMSVIDEKIVAEARDLLRTVVVKIPELPKMEFV